MGKLTLRDPSRRAAPTNKNWNSGFTLVETLLVVAILAILLALSMVGVIHYRDYLKITELDNAARDICMAAQNRAVLLQNSGRLDGLLADEGGGHAVPAASPNDGTRYISNRAADADVLDELVPAGTIDPALRDSGEFYVVYEPDSGSVTDVFYMETKDQVSIGEALGLVKPVNDRDRRMNNKTADGKPAMVGYYGSKKGEAIGTHPLPTPGVEVFIENGDELTLTVRYTLPAEGLPDGGVTRVPSVKLKCGDGEVALLEVNNVGDLVPLSDSRRKSSAKITDPGVASAEYTWVLDSLESDKQFHKFAFKDSHGSAVSPALGGNFTVTAGLTLKASGYIDSAYYTTGKDNSLFDASTQDGDTAYIANLRHLQNLDKVKSGVGDGIKNAVQLWDIDCAQAKHNNGDPLDPAPDYKYNFFPINNDNLKSYDGKGKSISNLYVDRSGSAGLFGGLKGTGADDRVTVKDVRLINAEVIGDTAGALAGDATDAAFTNVQVYWSKPERLAAGSDFVMVKGAVAGGMVGETSGAVTITDSFAATTVEGTTTAAGGLVGSGSVSLTRSYADCYLTGDGFIGGLTGSGSVGLNNCYAAGFIVDPADAGKTAGLVNGSASVTGGSWAYSAVRRLKTEDSSLDKPGKLLADELSGEAGYLYTQADAAIADPGEGFRYPNPENQTHVYNLRYRLYHKPEDKLKAPYIFPGLDGLPHYGDWAELTLPAGLAYYEAYADGSFGAEGFHEPEDPGTPNIATLKRDADNPVVRKDGYALVYRGESPSIPAVTIAYAAQIWRLEDETWTLENPAEGDTTTSEADRFTVRQGSVKYTLVPLPDRVMTGELDDTDNFFQRLEYQVKLENGFEVKESERSFYFNPHFAKTVKSGTVTTTSYTKPEEPDEPKDSGNPVWVRTPRHLYNLSHFQTSDHNYAVMGFYYRQELDLDYSAYTVGYPGSFQYIPGTGNYKQYAIGKSAGGTYFDGAYDGQYHMITNVFFRTETPGTDLGLFGKTASGSVLKNIVYEQKIVLDAEKKVKQQTVEKDNTHVGALVGLNLGTVTNCAVFGVSMNVKVMNAGGLAGKNDGVIKNCAAEVVSLTTTLTSGGGLVGENANEIENCYAVGRIDGTSYGVGGLVGKNTGTIKSSYAAVDLINNGGCDRHGFCLNQTADGRTGSYDDKSGWLGDVYGSRGIKCSFKETTDYTTPDSALPVTALEAGPAELSKAGAAVRNIPGGADYASVYQGKTYPYRTWVKTKLSRNPDTGKITGTVTETPIHYGLWPVAAPVGLAYYEKYKDGSCGMEGFYQPESSDAPTFAALKMDTDNPVVTRDGYALVFKGREEDIPVGEYRVRYGKINEQVWTLTKAAGADKNEYRWTRGGTAQTVDWVPWTTDTGARYTLIPLPDEIVTGELPDEDFVYKKDADGNIVKDDANKPIKEEDKSLFYQKLRSNLQSFYFNPYFARTVRMPEANGEAPVNPKCVWGPIEEEPTNAERSEIVAGDPAVSIRTARHFYNLSAHRSTPGDYYYLQELDLDYGPYEWKEAGPRLDRTGDYYMQAPISIRDKLDKQLVFTYDGGYHQISSVVFEGTERVNPTDTEVCTGLFAGVWWDSKEASNEKASVLKNAVYKMKPTSYYEIRTESGSTVVIGCLVGSLAGIVRNCAAYDVCLHVNVKDHLTEEEKTNFAWNRTVTVGGLVGRMRGTVANCSAELYDLRAYISENGSAGGLVGRMMDNANRPDGGRIYRSYAMGKVTTVNNGRLAGGLVGERGQYGVIEDCYAAVAVGGNYSKKYGLFGPTVYVGQNLKEVVLYPNNSYWLSGLDYDTSGNLDVNIDDEPEHQRTITPGELEGKISTLSPMTEENHGITVTGKEYGSPYTGDFPYLSGVKTKLKRKADGTILGRLTQAVPVHYGLWPVEKQDP